MRIIAFALSTVLLSGCSWLGNTFGAGGHYKAKNNAYNYQGHGGQGTANPCQVPAPNYPIPRGCDPASVTIGTGGGFAQQPNFGAGPSGSGGQYAQAGYGSHANDARAHSDFRGQRVPKLRKPKWRGQLSLGAEKSISGNVIDMNGALEGYDPTAFDDVVVSRSGRRETTVTYSAGPLDLDSTDLWHSATSPSISYDDAWSTPAQIALGGEYILSKDTTLFANVGYTHAEGETGTGASVDGYLRQTTSYQDFDTAGNPIAGAPLPVTVQSSISKRIANFNYDFSDMRRYDLEFGARRYFKPVVTSADGKTLTPFVGASVGASHYEGVSYTIDQEQLNYRLAVVRIGSSDPDAYSTLPGERVDLYDSQWVPSGQLNAGVDWQLTPKTALAFETGVRIEGAREYSNGDKGDKNIAIPFKIRGSYNF